MLLSRSLKPEIRFILVTGSDIKVHEAKCDCSIRVVDCSIRVFQSEV